MRNPSEPYRYPHQFFQNSSSSSSSSPPETDSSNELGNATNGIPNDSDTCLSPKSLSKKEEIKEKDSSYSVDPSPFKGSSSLSSAKKVHIPLPPFLYRLKKKYQAHVEKIRETFSQVEINIHLLDAIQQMPPYAKFLKDLCTN